MKRKFLEDLLKGKLLDEGEMKELVDYLKNPTKYRDSGARIPKGIS